MIHFDAESDSNCSVVTNSVTQVYYMYECETRDYLC